jgi:ribonuclease G
VRGSLVLLATLGGGRTAAARLVDGRLDDLIVDPVRDDPTPRPGAIHRARLGRPMKGLGGAIVEVGQGQTGFLRDTRGLAQGRPVLVQVSAWAEPHKAPPVTRRLLIKRRLGILTPGAPGLNLARSLAAEARPRLEALAAAAMAGASDDLGLILRSAAADALDPEIAVEVAALRAAWDRLEPDGAPVCLLPAPTAAEEARRDWPDPGPGGLRDDPAAFDDHGVWEAIDALRSPTFALPGGAELAVEPTRALVAVDVNTGGDLTPAAALKANLAAARELPRQLRLRGLGGQVAIDFAPLAKPERGRVTDALTVALARDSIETTIVGWTPLGHLELARRRSRRPLDLAALGSGPN